jgi:hypothetical protein
MSYYYYHNQYQLLESCKNYHHSTTSNSNTSGENDQAYIYCECCLQDKYHQVAVWGVR